MFHDVLFADDTSLIGNLRSFGPEQTNIANRDTPNLKINQEIQKIQTWLNLNKLSLNVKKTKFIEFRQPNQKPTDHLHLQINNTPIEKVVKFSFLGLIINDTLTWSDHVKETSNKVSKVLGIMNRLKNILPSHILKTIYSSLILSRLHYCNLVWGHKPNRLKTLQKRAIRIIMKAKYNAHTDPLFKQLQTLKLEDIHMANKLKFSTTWKMIGFQATFGCICLQPIRPHQ